MLLLSKRAHLVPLNHSARSFLGVIFGLLILSCAEKENKDDDDDIGTDRLGVSGGSVDNGGGTYGAVSGSDGMEFVRLCCLYV